MSRSGPFSSEFVRNLVERGGEVSNKTSSDLAGLEITSTSSFRYDGPGSGLKSSQQVNVDFSLFANHSFFSSAQVNVNVAFDRVINEFPFDGTNNEYNEFLDKLTGFENYVLGLFPTSRGFLYFSGSSEVSVTGAGVGTHVSLVDAAGSLFPELSKDKSGKSVLNPDYKSLSIESHIFLPAVTNTNQVIYQKVQDGNTGFSLFLSESSSTTSASLYFAVSSGSQQATTSMMLNKGAFKHVTAILNRNAASDTLELYLDDDIISSSSANVTFDKFDIDNAPFMIGSGTIHNRVAPGAISFVPAQTFSGALDELRIFHTARGRDDILQFAQKGIFASEELKLYYKFNEPSGSYTSNNIVLDSSGNSLHGTIANFTTSSREAAGLANPITYELEARNPILFPTYTPLATINSDLLTSASRYDDHNPNLITRLVPQHYFLEGEAYEGFENEEGTIVESFTGTSIPGSGKLGTAQVMSAFLYTWAKELDELKIILDSFGRLLHIDYDKNENIPDQFLEFLASYYGMELPSIFSDASFRQFYDGDDLLTTAGAQQHGLKFVQNEIWRRILINIRDIIDSKGTIHSVKSIIRAVGINPDNNFRIREFGGPTKGALKVSRQNKSEVSSLLDFSGSLAGVTSTTNAQGIPNNKPFLMSPFLSGARNEVGYPEPQGTFVNQSPMNVHGTSNDPDDGLFTSGSFTYEGIYRFPFLLSGSYHSSQSLVRLHVTGGMGSKTSQNHGVLSNLVAVSGTNKVKLFVRPFAYTYDEFPETQELVLDGPNLFDGNAWNISFGRIRSDDSQLLPIERNGISSSYFIRCARQNFGTIEETYVTSSFSISNMGFNVFNATNVGTYNKSGSFICIGSQSLAVDDTLYLNTSGVNAAARSTYFDGRVGQMRFWSRGLQKVEWLEHVRNFKSLGVQDPLVKFNFVTMPTGSFGKLRLDVSADQIETQSNGVGGITLFDYTQHRVASGTAGFPWRMSTESSPTRPDTVYQMSGTGFEPSRGVIKPETFYFSLISPRFDEASTTEKVRPRGFLDSSLLEEFPYAQVAPAYEIRRSEQPTDDTRFSIEFSVVDALNEDIMTMFATLSSMNDAIGSPGLLFSPDYPELENMRDIYFNRLTDKMNLKGFFEFFKWFDTTIGSILVQLIPRKTNYLGSNFVVESHMLERPKVEYYYSDMYLGENNRPNLKGIIRLQQFVGKIRRF